ncbi:hypothetical protein VNO77_03028 [Canavalia gladiata]|uniref:Uncharacterized protein n=1 Tax=Canavalia gladiata TaxID=3824 RepID=A0AAN9MU16_CANGL
MHAKARRGRTLKKQRLLTVKGSGEEKKREFWIEVSGSLVGAVSWKGDDTENHKERVKTINKGGSQSKTLLLCSFLVLTLWTWRTTILNTSLLLRVFTEEIAVDYMLGALCKIWLEVDDYLCCEHANAEPRSIDFVACTGKAKDDVEKQSISTDNAWGGEEISGAGDDEMRVVQMAKCIVLQHPVGMLNNSTHRIKEQKQLLIKALTMPKHALMRGATVVDHVDVWSLKECVRGIMFSTNFAISPMPSNCYQVHSSLTQRVAFSGSTLFHLYSSMHGTMQHPRGKVPIDINPVAFYFVEDAKYLGSCSQKELSL